MIQLFWWSYHGGKAYDIGKMIEKLQISFEIFSAKFYYKSPQTKIFQNV